MYEKCLFTSYLVLNTLTHDYMVSERNKWRFILLLVIILLGVYDNNWKVVYCSKNSTEPLLNNLQK
jgi:hypothetical protein